MRSLRTKRKWSQTDLALRADVDRNYISLIELGRNSPSVRLLFKLTVRQIIGIERLGSPATLHKRLMRLREMDLVDAAFQGSDRRTKYLSPSAKGLKYAEGLGKAFALTLQNT